MEPLTVLSRMVFGEISLGRWYLCKDLKEAGNEICRYPGCVWGRKMFHRGKRASAKALRHECVWHIQGIIARGRCGWGGVQRGEKRQGQKVVGVEEGGEPIPYLQDLCACYENKGV